MGHYKFNMDDKYFVFIVLFFNDTATTEIYTLALHDALPISRALRPSLDRDLEMIVIRCLQKPIDLRYATADQWEIGRAHV